MTLHCVAAVLLAVIPPRPSMPATVGRCGRKRQLITRTLLRISQSVTTGDASSQWLLCSSKCAARAWALDRDVQLRKSGDDGLRGSAVGGSLSCWQTL
jgi:hypothetical protein